MNLLFYTCASGKYSEFILPYITAALLSNPDSGAEILTDSNHIIIEGNRLLREVFPGRAFIREVPSRLWHWTQEVHLASSIRFVTQPIRMAQFTYIGDIDILITEPIAEGHQVHMDQMGLCYSNVIRPGTKRLTGLHFVKTADWYRRFRPAYLFDLIRWYERVNLRSDESLLYKMAEENVKLPDPKETYRPVHGIHFSPNRMIDSDPGWGVTKKKVSELLAIMDLPQWKAMEPYFSKDILEKIRQSIKYAQTL